MWVCGWVCAVGVGVHVGGCVCVCVCGCVGGWVGVGMCGCVHVPGVFVSGMKISLLLLSEVCPSIREIDLTSVNDDLTCFLSVCVSSLICFPVLELYLSLCCERSEQLFKFTIECLICTK